MGAQDLGSRAIIGEYYARLEQHTGASWVSAITNLFDSDQESETYKWLGQTPAMREWVGGRHAKGFTTNGITIENLEFEATLGVPVKDLRRDKSGQLMARIDDLAERTVSHWAKLLSTLIENGEATVCYDGQYFFDTDHAEGDSGSQSNDISVDISGLPVAVEGTTTAPSPGQMQGAILKTIEQIVSLKDDQGEPINEGAREFLVMVPASFMHVAAAAVALPMVDGGNSNLIPAMSDLSIRVAANPRLSWTTKFATFRADGAIKALIRQEEVPPTMSAIAEGSELEFRENRHEYGVYASRNTGYGLWQKACLATLI